MANIKFSQFTVGNTESDIDFVVGYKGANNIQISPTNLLAASLSGYLPLTGGTMTGDIIFNDGVKAKFGTGLDLNIYHTGTGSVIQNAVGNLTIQQDHNNGDIIFRCDDGSGGTVEYLIIDGSAEQTRFFKDTRHTNNIKANFGNSDDLQIYHNGTNSLIENNTGNLNIINYADDKDITFRCDDGSGGVTEYFKLDGSQTILDVAVRTLFRDNVKATFGAGYDLEIYHDGSNSFIRNTNTNLYIKNEYNDGDIIFESDDGSGNIAEYFRVDGSGVTITVSAGNGMVFFDNIKAKFGNTDDLQIFHSGASSSIRNQTGDLYIQNLADDSDIIFQSDNGSGGTTEYFRLDGSDARMYASREIRFVDGVASKYGNSGDLSMYHNGDSFIVNETGNLKIVNGANDSDIVFQSDDGAGGVATYFLLDGSLADGTNFYTRFLDRSRACFGDSIDLQVFHNGTNSYIENNTGDFLLVNYANDKDIKFFSDDGSGGTTEYFRVDGSSEINIFSKSVRLNDSVELQVGAGQDLKIYHNGTNSYLENETGDLYIRNNFQDRDIIFQSDDGGGGIATYFQLDGSLAAGGVPVTRFPDNSKLGFGDSTDLQIYHDGSNSYIKDGGTGSLKILAQDLDIKNAADSASMIRAIDGAQVELYYGGAKKIETKSTGIKISGVSEYADNTAAIAGGLTTGDVYRTGDLLKIVH